MATITRMPELAANTPDALLTEWLVKEGDQVSAGDPIATVETAKATVDIEAETTGWVLRLMVEDGAEVLVGAPILVLGDQGEDLSGLDLGPTPGAAPESVVEEPAAEPERPTPVPVAEVAPATPDEPRASQPATPSSTARIFASPLARKLARDAGLSLDVLSGSGPNGRVVRRDVAAALSARAAAADLRPAAPPATAVGAAAVAIQAPTGFTDIPHSRLRRAIASRLAESKRDAPHFYLRGSVDVTALLKLRRKLVQEAGAQISLNDLIVKAVALAHLREPGMNCIWTDDAVRMFDTVDVAIAVATDNGLVTPVVRGVDSLSLSALASRTRAFVASAREGSLKPQDLQGGSVTVSNLGMFGTQEFAAIINPPHASILAVGAARDSAVVRDGKVVVAKEMTFTLSVDHRPVDGAVAASWMREFLALIEVPSRLTV